MRQEPEPLRLALFDLDHTLLDGDSNTLWLDFLAEHGHVPPHAGRMQAEHMAAYVAGQLDIDAYLGFHLGLLAGQPLSHWAPIRDRFIAERIAPRIPDAACRAVAGHQARGHRMAIVTATHSFLSEAIAGLFGLALIAPQAEVRDGRLTGRIVGLPCFQEKKLACLQAWLEKEGLDKEPAAERHFYSDSANDLPLLEYASHPVAVNPDGRLAEIAGQRGWPIRVWRCE